MQRREPRDRLQVVSDPIRMCTEWSTLHKGWKTHWDCHRRNWTVKLTTRIVNLSFLCIACVSCLCQPEARCKSRCFGCLPCIPFDEQGKLDLGFAAKSDSDLKNGADEASANMSLIGAWAKTWIILNLPSFCSGQDILHNSWHRFLFI